MSQINKQLLLLLKKNRNSYSVEYQRANHMVSGLVTLKRLGASDERLKSTLNEYFITETIHGVIGSAAHGTILLGYSLDLEEGRDIETVAEGLSYFITCFLNVGNLSENSKNTISDIPNLLKDLK
eukprot:gene3895-7108_t